MMDNDELLTIEDTMKILHIRRTSLYKLMQKPTSPPFLTIGRRKIIRKSALMQWISENEGKASVM